MLNELCDGHPEVLGERVRRVIKDARVPSHRYSRNGSQHEAVVEGSLHFVFVLSSEGIVRSASPSAIDRLGTTNKTVTASPFYETPLWSEKVQSDVRRLVHRAADGEDVEWESTRMRSGDSDLSVSGEIRPTTDKDGEVSTLVVVGKEMIERGQAEKDVSTTK